MRTPEAWGTYARGLLKAEMARRDVGYQDLVGLLRTVGVDESAENLTNKINRGKFSAIFFLQCLEAMACKTIRIGDE
jgi:hypothetical protein